MNILVTSSPNVTVAEMRIEDNLTVAEIVERVTANFKVAVAAYEEIKSKDQYAMPFVEIYEPAYNDALSGEVTIALMKACKVMTATKTIETHVPRAKPPVLAQKLPKVKVAKVKANRAVNATKAATGAKSKAEQVRDIIRANPTLTAEQIIPIAVAQLGMKVGQAKIYVPGNVKLVRGE